MGVFTHDGSPVTAQVLDKLDGVTGSDPQWYAKCPAHDDNGPSLSVAVGDDGLPVVTCHAGCTYTDIHAGLIGLGVPRKALRGTQASPGTPGTRQPKRPAPRAAPPNPDDLRRWTKALTDEMAETLAELRGLKVETSRSAGIGWDATARRYVLPVADLATGEVVDLRLYAPDVGAGGRKMVHRKGGTARLYAPGGFDAAESVVLCEGEWDALVARERGFNAVATTGGAGTVPRLEFLEPLRGCTVILAFDCDDAGRKGAAAWARRLTEDLDCVVAIADLGLGDKEDVSDWFVKYGKSAKKFQKRLDGAAPWVEEQQQAPSGPARRAILTSASSIRPERQLWLWDNRIPIGGLCLLAGREGLGKSTIAVDLAARVTRGLLAGEFRDQCRDVLIVSTEDNLGTTVAPRLIAAEATMDRVHFLTVEEDGFSGQPVFPPDIDLLGDAIEQTKAALVILDACTSVIDDKLDSNQGRPMRRALEPLSRLAGEHDCAMLGIVHFGKRESSDTGKLILDSIAWSQVARSVLAVAKDSEFGHLVVEPTKHNLAPGNTPGLAARLVPVEVPTDDGPTSAGSVEWLGETDTHVGDLLSRKPAEPEDHSDRDEAAAWLVDYLTDNDGQASAGDAFKAAKLVGFSETTVKRARKHLSVQTAKVGYQGAWVWTLPPKTPKGSGKGTHAWTPDSLDPLDSLGAKESNTTYAQYPKEYKESGFPRARAGAGDPASASDRAPTHTREPSVFIHPGYRSSKSSTV